MAFSTSSFSQAPFASQGTVSITVVLTGVGTNTIARIGSVNVVSGSLILVASLGIPAKIGTAVGTNNSSLTLGSVSTKPNVATVTTSIDGSVTLTAVLAKPNIGTVEGQVTEVVLQGISSVSSVATVTPVNDSLIVAAATNIELLQIKILLRLVMTSIL